MLLLFLLWVKPSSTGDLELSVGVAPGRAGGEALSAREGTSAQARKRGVPHLPGTLNASLVSHSCLQVRSSV